MTARDLVRFLKAQGFAELRQSGSHLVLAHAVRKTTITVPMHGSTDIGRGLAIRLLRDAGYSVDDYVRLR